MFEYSEKITKGIIGRKQELIAIISVIKVGKHILLEGPPGTSKSTLLRTISRDVNIPFFMIEGNIDLTPSKLVGNFNPAKVMADSYKPEYFEKGPLTLAMEQGGILYIEEFNRMPADVSNVLITPMEEGEMHIPRYGLVKALPTFTVVAAQNPYDDVGTVRVSRAFMDRICLIKMDYQNEKEEQEIVIQRTGCQEQEIVRAAVRMVRKTREHPDIKIGASVRAAIDLVELYESMRTVSESHDVNFYNVACMALANKIWLNETSNRKTEEVIEDIWQGLKVDLKDLAGNREKNLEAIKSEEGMEYEETNDLIEKKKIDM